MPDTNLADDPVALLQELIRKASVTPVDDGVLDVVEQALRPLGFAVTRMQFDGDGSYPVDNLFATRAPVGSNHGRHLLFAGHTDVVPPGDATLWTHPPFAAEIADGKMFGRGAADMKSGVAAFIAAVAQAVADGSADGGNISLVITNDEEADSINGTEKVMQWAAAQGHRFDFAVVGEPSAIAISGDRLKVGRRGSFSGKIAVIGAQGHVAYPERAKNPVPVAAAIVTALSGQLDEGNASFQPSNLEVTSLDVANTAGNVIPAQAVLKFNVRHNDKWTAESLAAEIRGRLARVDAAGCRIEFVQLGREARCFLCPQGEGMELLSETIAAINGAPPELSTTGGTSDARFIAQYCPVVECGLPGPTMHKADEHVGIADLEALTRLYTAFIGRYFAA